MQEEGSLSPVDYRDMILLHGQIQEDIMTDKGLLGRILGDEWIQTKPDN
jgi:hypothetical protein